MVGFPFLAVGFIMNIVAVLFVVCSVALILIILIQKGRGGGLSAAFGGGSGGGVLGSKTGDFLTWVTVGLVGVFLLLAVVMARFYRPTVTDVDVATPPGTRAPATTPPPAGQPTNPEQPTGSGAPLAPPLGTDGGESSGGS